MSETSRSNRWKWAIVLLLVAIGLTWMLWPDRSRAVEYSLVLRAQLAEQAYSRTKGGRATNIYVVRAPFDEAVQIARTDLVAQGWTERLQNLDGKAGGGPFADYLGPGKSIRVIRGDRTFPPSLRSTIPIADGRNWVVISAEAPPPSWSEEFGRWWRKLFRGP